jgi:hypothetical protein
MKRSRRAPCAGLEPFEPQTHNTLADAQEELSRCCLATYQQALHLFPYNQGLYYNQSDALAPAPYRGGPDQSAAQPELATKAGTHRLLGSLQRSKATLPRPVSWLAGVGPKNGPAVNDADRCSSGSQGVAVVPTMKSRLHGQRGVEELR